jgi:hypothetical protein
MVTVCLLAGLLAGCGGDGGSGSGGPPTGQTSRNTDEPGDDGTGQEPGQRPSQDEPAQEPAGQGPTGQGGEPGRRDGPGDTPGGRPAQIPPGLVESRLAGIAEGLAGQVGMAVSGPGGPGPLDIFGELSTGPALSTINLPIAERVLEDGGGPRDVDAPVREQTKAAISRSDPEAARALVSHLESNHGGPAGASQALGQSLRVPGGSPETTPAPTPERLAQPHLIEWPLVAQTRFVAALVGGCRGDTAVRKYLLASMAPSRDRERYGLGSVGPEARWIGSSGKGPEGNTLIRQTGVFHTDGGPVAVSMFVLPYDGSPRTGKAMLTEVAERLVSRLGDQGLRRYPCPRATGPRG